MKNKLRLFIVIVLCLLAFPVAIFVSACSCGGEEEHQHSWGAWQMISEPGCITDGREERICSGCGESEVRDIPALGHIGSEEYMKDYSSHWKVCETCGEKFDSAAHDFGADNVCKICGYEVIVSDGLAFAENADGKSYTVVGIGTFEGEELAVPSYYEGLPVTVVGENAFSGTDITSVKLPDTVEKIGPYAFGGCGQLIKAEIGGGIEYIGDYAFDDCFDLMSVSIGNAPDYVGQYAFRDCFRLVEVFADDSLKTEIGSREYGYLGFYALDIKGLGEASALEFNDKDYVFYAGDEISLIAYIGESADIVLPEDFDGKSYSVNDFAFYGDTTITSLNVGGAESIGKNAFKGCENIASLDLSGVTSLGESAFGGCSSLSEVNLGGELTEIGKYAFESCGSLSEIYIPKNVSVIKDYAFDGCDALTSINCESESKPAGWTEYWNWYSDAVINWGMAPEGGN